MPCSIATVLNHVEPVEIFHYLGLYLFERLFCWAYFRGSLCSDGRIIGRNFAFQNGLALTCGSLKNNENSLKQLKTACTKSLWVYIRECSNYRKDFCV